MDPAASTLRLKLAGKDVDVSRVRDTALKIAGDVGVIEDIFRHVKAGKIPEITVQTAGPSFAELWKNIGVTGTLRDGNILTYPLDIDLEEVSGLFVFSGGIFEAKQFSARSGKMQQSDGTLRLGFEGKNAPFHLDIMIDADAAELHSFLFRVFKDDGLRKELSRVRNLEGELSGRLIIGEKIDSLSARVTIMKAAVRALMIGSPILSQSKRGSFSTAKTKLRWRVSVAQSAFHRFQSSPALSNYNDPRQVEISSAKFALDLAQTKNLLNRFELLREELSDIAFARGRLDVTSLSLKGPLDEPSRWDFSSAALLARSP